MKNSLLFSIFLLLTLLSCRGSVIAGDYIFPEGTNIVTARDFSDTSVRAGDTLTVSFDLLNREGDSLRGFYYTDQIPAGFEVLTDTVLLNGGIFTDYIYEVGGGGSVYSGSVPYRWVIEVPDTDGFVENHPVYPSTGGVRIVYSLVCPDSGVYVFPGYSWVANLDTISGGEVFGYDDSTIVYVAETTAVGPHFSTWGLPGQFLLGQNYPNPFNSTTAISYAVPSTGQLSAVSDQQSADGGQRTAVTLKIYNSLGEKVRDLIDEEQRPGYYMAVWNGRDNTGKDVSSGIYFCRLEAMGGRLKVGKIRKMILVR